MHLGHAKIGIPAAKKTSHKELRTLQRKCERERSKEAKKVEKLRAAEIRRAEMKEKKRAISLKNRSTNGDLARNHGGNADQNAADLEDNGGDAALDQSSDNGCKTRVSENMKKKATKNRGTNGDLARNHGGNADQNAADLEDNGGDAALDQSADNGCKTQVCENMKKKMTKNGGNADQENENTNFNPITAAAPDQNAADLEDNGGDAALDESADNGCKTQVCENMKKKMTKNGGNADQENENTNFNPITTAAPDQNAADLEDNGGDAALDQSSDNGCKTRVSENTKKKTTKNGGTNGDPARNHGGNADQNAADLEDNGGDAALDESAENGCKTQVCENMKKKTTKNGVNGGLEIETACD